MGVGPYFYSFSMEKQLFWPISCTCLTKQTFNRPGLEYFKYPLTVFSDSTHSVKAVDLQNKKKEEEEEEEVGEMGIFYNLSKIMKLALFILIKTTQKDGTRTQGF